MKRHPAIQVKIPFTVTANPSVATRGLTVSMTDLFRWMAVFAIRIKETPIPVASISTPVEDISTPAEMFSIPPEKISALTEKYNLLIGVVYEHRGFSRPAPYAINHSQVIPSLVRRLKPHYMLVVYLLRNDEFG